jgi:hypothetical protein
MTVTPPITHRTAETRLVEAAGVELAYRRFGADVNAFLAGDGS